jgi:hypothetical protein
MKRRKMSAGKVPLKANSHWLAIASQHREGTEGHKTEQEMIQERLWAKNRYIQGLQANHTTTSWHFVGDVCSFALFMPNC